LDPLEAHNGRLAMNGGGFFPNSQLAFMMIEGAYSRREESPLLELLRENLDRNNKERIISSNFHTLTLEFRTAAEQRSSVLLQIYPSNYTTFRPFHLSSNSFFVVFLSES
jgi:hypothetical protein